MNQALRKLATKYDLDSDEHSQIRLSFGLACVQRVRDHLIDSRVVDVLEVGLSHLEGRCTEEEFNNAVEFSQQLASSHMGSNSLDGSGSAAVSSTYALCRAMRGQALEAADYAAYAKVYAYASYAVTDPSAYESEYLWQVNKFKQMTIL